MWRLKPPHKVNVNVKVKDGGVDGFDFDVDFVGALRATPVPIGRSTGVLTLILTLCGGFSRHTL
ncbi:MAG: hypothetical protein LBH93_05950 [Chitinispirillales bacterium]|nr:hypothetical protein [Chitinispirillales bacterium]